MAARIEGLFDRAADASLDGDEPAAKLPSYLADAHAIEAQAIVLLERARNLEGPAVLAAAYEEHLEETHRHEELLERRLDELGSSPSTIKDAALRLGALNWSVFFAAQPDTPAKLAGFAFAFEHLEIASYELLARVAERAGDAATAELAARIGAEERAAAGRLHELLDTAMDATLQARAVSG